MSTLASPLFPVRRIHNRQTRPALSTLAVLIGSMLAAPGVYANPTGGTVVGGAATIGSSAPGVLDIRQSTGKAIINWQTFGIGKNETVNFLQPSSSSVTLNRVLGNDPSAIFGRMTANGTVMLVNPNGVVFGPNSSVDVGGLVATTANIRDQDFMAGKFAFGIASPNKNASVINQGQISIRDSGLAALVAPSVQNSGVIEAKLGRVALGGAQTFNLDFQGDGMLSFDATSVVSQLPKDANGKPVGALVSNTGTISADGGSVLLTAQAVKDVVDSVINTSGIIQARSVDSHNGVIVLSGGSAGTVSVSGTLDASAQQAGGTGGKVVVTGQDVELTGTARVDVSGTAGGGEIALGSTGLRGTAAAAADASTFLDKSETLTVANGAQLKADALDQGNGGAISMWSTDATRFDGALSARGGAQGGDGGFAEVSSLNDFGLTGTIDLSAPLGKGGAFLLDPATIEITDDSDSSSDGTGSVVTRGWLEAQAGNADITLQSSGSITVDKMASGRINLQTGTGNTFTLHGGATIVFNDPPTEISTRGGNIVIKTDDGWIDAGNLTSNGGDIRIEVTTTDGMIVGKLTSDGGDIVLQDGISGVSIGQGGIWLEDDIDAGTGTLTIEGLHELDYIAQYHGTLTANTIIIDASAIGWDGQPIVFAAHQISASSATDIWLQSTGATNVTDLSAGTNISLITAGDLTVAGAINAIGNVTLTAQSGDILSNGAADAVVTGADVTLTANNGGKIGSDTGLLLTDTQDLTLNGASDISVGIAQPLTDLTISRRHAASGGSSNGTILVLDAGGSTVFNATTLGGSTRINSVDATGVNLTFDSTNSLVLSNIDSGSLTLTADGDISGSNGAIVLTAGNISLTANGAGSTIGSTVQNLMLDTDRLSASAGTGGIYLEQSHGDIELVNVTSAGGLSLMADFGNITLDDVAGNSVSITSHLGSILSGTGGGVVSTSTQPGSTISLSATSGIGTNLAPVKVTAGAAQVTAHVTRQGDLYLHGVGGLGNGVNTSTMNGATHITSDGTVLLLNLFSQTDASGNDITVTTTSGEIIIGNVQAGSFFDTITLTADQGDISTSVDVANPSLSASGISLHANGDIFSSVSSVGGVDTFVPLDFTANHIDAASLTGSIYLHTAGSTTLTDIDAGRQNIEITAGGSLTVGAIEANTASLTATTGNIVDDGDDTTVIAADSLTLSAATGIGPILGQSLQTQTHLLRAETTGSGDIYIANTGTGNLQLSSVTAADGDINITNTATGTTTLADVESSGHDIFVLTIGGDIAVVKVDAQSTGQVELDADGGSIIRDASDTAGLISGGSISLRAQDDIGAVSDLSTGDGTPIRIDTTHLSLTTPTRNGVINIFNVDTGSLALDSLSSGNASVFIKTQGDLDASAWGGSIAGSLLLDAIDGTLILPFSGIDASRAISGSVNLHGGTDIVTNGIGTTARTIGIVGATWLTFSSGALGGDVTLDTSVSHLTASLGGTASLNIANLGTLTVDSASTAAGDIDIETLTGALNISGAVAGGSGSSLTLIADSGDIDIGDNTFVDHPISAGVQQSDGRFDGHITLNAAGGSLSLLNPEQQLDADWLTLTSATGIGSLAPFQTSAGRIDTTVTGDGGINLAIVGGSDHQVNAETDGVGDIAISLADQSNVQLGNVSTHDGNISVTGSQSFNDAGDITATSGTLSAGSGGNITLSTQGTIDLRGVDLSTSEGVSLIGSQVDLGALDIGSGFLSISDGNGVGNVLIGGDLSAGLISIGGNVTFSGGNGTTRTLTAVGTRGSITINGTLDGGGMDAHLSADSVFLGAAANAAFNLSSLAIDQASIIVLAGVTTIGNQTYTGTNIFLRGDYSTSGASIEFAGKTSLNGDVGIDSYVLFEQTLDSTTAGGAGLSITGGVLAEFHGDVGASGALSTLAVTDAALFEPGVGSVTTTGSQTYGQLAMTGDLVLIGGAMDIQSINSFSNLAIDAGAGSVTFGSQIGSSSFRMDNLTITTDGDIAFNGDVYAASLTTIGSGGSVYLPGIVDTGTGTQTYGQHATLRGDTFLQGSLVTLAAGADSDPDSAGNFALNIIGSADITGDIGATTALESLTITGAARLAAAGTAANDIITIDLQTYGGAVTLAGDQSLTSSDGAIVFRSTVDGDSALTIHAGLGAVHFEHAIGASARLGDLEVDTAGTSTFDDSITAASFTTDTPGTLVLNTGSVDTTGAQSYGEHLTLTTDTILKGSSITLRQGADAAVDGQQSLTIDGDAIFGGAIGRVGAALDSLSVSGTTAMNAAAFPADTIVTVNSQSYGGAVTLGAEQDLQSSNGDIVFHGAIDGDRANSRSLTIVASTGDVEVDGAIGATIRLGDLDVETNGLTTFNGSVAAASLSMSSALVLNSSLVDTVGHQTYNGHILLAADTTLRGSTVTLNGGADATAAGAQSLTIDGDAFIEGALGGVAGLKSLDITGTTALLTETVTTTGAQNYEGAVTLFNNQTTLTSGGVVFGDTVDGVTDDSQSLAVNAGAGDVAFDGSIGTISRLDSLEIATSGNTTFGGLITQAASIFSNGAGNVIVDGSVDTTGSQSYQGQLILAGDTTLTGSTVVLSQGANGASAGGQSLVIDGAADITGDVGAAQALKSLTVTGMTALHAATGATQSIVTTGLQSYRALAFDADESIRSASGGIAFAGTVDGTGGGDLTVNGGTGDVVFGNAVGSLIRLGTLSVNTAGLTRFGGTVRAASIATDTAGSLSLDGGSVDTTGAQSYGERAVLGADTTLTGATITLAQGADSADDDGQSLSIVGDAVIDGNVGAVKALATLDVSGATQFGAGATTIATLGAQTYGGAATLGADLSLTGGAIIFHGSVDGSHALTIQAGSSDVTFDDAIGSTTRLGDLDVETTGLTTFDGAVAAASLTLPGALALNAGSVDTTGQQTYGQHLVLTTDTTLKGSLITLDNGVDATAIGGQFLAIEGNAAITGNVGIENSLGSLTITGTTTLHAANSSTTNSIVTTGAQSYGDALVFDADQSMTSAGSAITFHGTVNGAHDLIINAGQGDVSFDSTVGAADAPLALLPTPTRLGNLIVDSSGATTFGGAVHATSVTTDTDGTLALDGGSIDTTNQQSYGEHAVLGTDATLTGAWISFGQGVDAATAGQQGLTIVGEADLSGDVGVGAALKSLTVTGNTFLDAANGSDSSTLVTVGAQRYDGDFLSGADQTLTSASGGITFTGAVNGAHNLTVNGGTGDVVFGDIVGAAPVTFVALGVPPSHLDALVVNTSGATIFDGAVHAGSITTDSAGTLAINGGSVDTTNEQSYGERVVLGADTTLTGSWIAFGQGADAATAGQQGLTISGEADLSGDIGVGAALKSLTVTGNTFLDAADDADSNTIVTANSQTYDGKLVIDADQTLTSTSGGVTFTGSVTGAHDLTVNAGSGDVSFEGAVGSSGGIIAFAPVPTRLGELVVNSSGATTFDGAVQAVSVTTDTAGSLAINGGSVTTTGAQTYGEHLVLGTDTTLAGSLVTLAQGVDAATSVSAALSIAGDADITGDVGSAQALESLTITGTTALHAATGATQSIITIGLQSYGGALIFDANESLSSSGDGIAFAGTVDGAGDLTVNTADGADFDQAVGSLVRMGALTVNAAGLTRFGGTVRATSVITDAAGSLSLDGGSIDTTGNQTYGDLATLSADTTLSGATITLGAGLDATHGEALVIDGNAVIIGDVGATAALGSLNVTGTATLHAADGSSTQSIATSGSQSYTGALSFDADLTLSANGGVHFGKIDGAHDLTVDSVGDVLFNDAVGGTTRLGNLIIDAAGTTTVNGAISAASVTTDTAGSLLLGGGSVNTTGEQSYGERAVLGNDTTLTGTSISLNQGVDAQVAGGQSLTIAGDASITGDIGTGEALKSLTITGATELFTSGSTQSIVTTGAQSYGGALGYFADESFTSASGGVSFTGPVSGAGDLTVNAGTGDVTFGADVGKPDVVPTFGHVVVLDRASTRIGNLVVNTSGATTFDGAVYATSVTTDAPGSLAINGGIVDTLNQQSYGEHVGLGSDTTLTGDWISFAQGADGTTAGQQSLTIIGEADLTGDVGVGKALKSLTVTGSTFLDSAEDSSNNTIVTAGAQTYDGRLVLDADQTLTSAAGGVTFIGTVNGTHNLTVNGGTGDVVFDDAVGASPPPPLVVLSLPVSRLGNLVVNTSGATIFDGAVKAASVTTDQPGSVQINGGSIDTTGIQSYGEQVILGDDATLTGSTITLTQGADATTDGGQSLTIDGNAIIGGSIGSTHALSSLAITGATALNGSGTGDTIATTGAQSYGDAVTLGADQTLASAGGGIAFAGTVNGGHGLTIDAGTGNVGFDQDVGAATRLGVLVVNTSGATTFGGTVFAAAVATDAAGTLDIAGGTINTTGAQSYGEHLTLGVDTTLQGSTITLAQGADAATDGGQFLVIDGDAVIDGNLGTSHALSSLNVTGATAMNGLGGSTDNAIITTGAQSYDGDVTLGSNRTLTGDGLTVGGNIDGGHDLTIDADAGDVSLDGNVGATARLGALTIDSSGITDLGGIIHAASVATDANGTVQIDGGSIDTTGDQTYGDRVTLSADTTLSGATVTVDAGLDATHGEALVIDGNAVIIGNVGAGAALGSLSITGTTTLHAADGSTTQSIATSGDQRYTGALGFDADLTLTAGGGIGFGKIDGAHDLTIDSVNDVLFNGVVGGTTRLGDLVIDAAGTTTFNGAVSAASVTTDTAGSLVLNGASINTTGEQNYGEHLLLGADTTLTGAFIALTQGVDGATVGGQALTVNGDAQIIGDVGAAGALKSLTISGTTDLDALDGHDTQTIATTGAQAYGDRLFIGADTTVNSGTGGVTFSGAVNGAHDLTVNAGAGDVVFDGAIGVAPPPPAPLVALFSPVTRLGNLVVNTSGATIFNGAVKVASVTTDQPGSVQINGGSVDTTGDQSYGEHVVLGTDTTLTGSTITLAQGADATTDGGQFLVVDGDAIIGGNVGATHALGSLDVTGATAMNGFGGSTDNAIVTTGGQTYSGDVTLGANRTLTADGDGVTFGGNLDGGHDLTINAGTSDVTFGNVGATTRLGALAVNTSGVTTFGGSVTAASVLTDATGTLAINGGSVDTTGTQSYGEHLVLGNDTTLTGSTITLAQGVDAAAAGIQSLTISGNAVITGNVGATAALTSLGVSGGATLHAAEGDSTQSIATTGTQSYGGDLGFDADLAITTTGGAVTFSGNVDGSAHSLSVDAASGDVSFAKAVGTAGRLGDLTVETSGATFFGDAVTAASVTTDTAGTLAINGGSINTTGDQSYGEHTVLGADTTLTGASISLNQGVDGLAAGGQSLTINGAASITGDIGTGEALKSLTITGTTELFTSGSTQSIVTTGAQSYGGALGYFADESFTSAGGGVSFAGTVNGAGDLTVNAGAGNVTFGAGVGKPDVVPTFGHIVVLDRASARIGNLVVNSSGATTFDGAVYATSVITDAPGSLTINGGIVDTTNQQSYGEHVVLGSDTTLTGDWVSFAQGADDTTAGQQSLTIAGEADLTGDIGMGKALKSLTVTGNTFLDAAGDSNSNTIVTAGAQTYDGRLVLDTDQTLTSAAGGVTFTGTVNGAHNLTVNGGTGDVVFGDAVGTAPPAPLVALSLPVSRLGNLVVNTSGATVFNGAVKAASVTTDQPGSVEINGGSVDTTGAQSYGEHVALGDDTTLTGSTITLAQGADASTDGDQSLTLDGDAVIGGSIGAVHALGSLAVIGTTAMKGFGGSTDNATITTGAQSYGGDVTLGANRTLTGTGVAFGGNIDGGHDLTINAGTGDVNLGNVGSSTRLGVLAINTSGATTFDHAIFAASVSTDAAGTLAINGGSINTTGDQFYGEHTVLGADTTLTGSSITFAQGADAKAPGEQALSIIGDANLGGPIGAHQALASLSIDGDAQLGADSIATVGGQTYSGDVVMTGSQSLTSQDGDIAFGDTVDGSGDLAIDAGTGNVSFAGIVGGAARLGNLTVNSGGETSFGGAITAASLTTDAAGTLMLGSGSVDTTGVQSYGEHLVLTRDTTLTGSEIDAANGIDATEAGSQGLTIIGNAVLGGDIGATGALKSLSVSGATAFDAGAVATTGDQHYTGAVTLNGDRNLQSSGGSLVFGSTIDAAAGANLALTAFGPISVDGAVGSTGSIGALTVQSGGTVAFGSDVHVASLKQTGAQGLTSFAGKLTADGADGIDLDGDSFRFDGAVTASQGAIALNSNDDASTINFAQGANVTAATGFTQTGGASVQLPSNIAVMTGPVSIEAVATLPDGVASIVTNGDITLTGLLAPNTVLNLTAGTGKLNLGLSDADPRHKLVVAGLAVSTASAAQLYGSINGQSGPLPASLIDSTLVASPYFMNDTPWGPVNDTLQVPSDVLIQLIATTTPVSIVPSTPTADVLFSRAILPAGFVPDVLSVFTAPQVLTIVPAATPNSSQPDGEPHAQRKAEDVQASASQRYFN